MSYQPLVAVPEPTILLKILQEQKETNEKITNLEKFAATAATAYRGTAQKIPNSVATVITINTALYDPNKLFNLVEGAYIAPEKGLYQVTGTVALTTVAEAEIWPDIRKNGADALRGTRLHKQIGVINVMVSGLMPCEAGEKIQLQVVQISGAEVELEILPVENRLSVVRVA